MQFDLFDPDRHELLGARSYAEFKERLAASGCSKCDLVESRTQIVVDRGVPGTGLMAIGEGPGQNEDLEGSAFVGRAGQLLTDHLAQFRGSENFNIFAILQYVHD